MYVSQNTLCVETHNSCTVWSEPICIKVNGWWQILSQHQSTYLRGPESVSIEIPPFLFSKTVSYEVNLTTQHSHLEVLLLSKFWSERRGFQLMQILGLLEMYFDAVVVEVKTFLLLFRLALAILWYNEFIRFFHQFVSLIFNSKIYLLLCNPYNLHMYNDLMFFRTFQKENSIQIHLCD